MTWFRIRQVLINNTIEPIARYRAVWFTVAFSVSFTMTAVGAGYAFAGANATAVPQAFKYVAILPGGLRTHGWILFLLGVGNFWSVAGLTQIYTKTSYAIGRITGIGILFYSVFTVFGLAAGFLVGHEHYTAGVWWYLMVAVLSAAKVSLPPPFKGQVRQDRPHSITGS